MSEKDQGRENETFNDFHSCYSLHVSLIAGWENPPDNMILLVEIFWDYSAGKWTFLNAFLGSVEHLYVCQQRGKCWKKGFGGKLSIVLVQKNIF